MPFGSYLPRVYLYAHTHTHTHMNGIKYSDCIPNLTSLSRLHTYPYTHFQLKVHAYTSITHPYTQIYIPKLKYINSSMYIFGYNNNLSQVLIFLVNIQSSRNLISTQATNLHCQILSLNHPIFNSIQF